MSGNEIRAGVVDEVVDQEDRAKLHESLDESIRQMKAGELIDSDDALAELRAHE